MLESKNIETPDEKVSTDHGDMHIINLSGFTLVRATFRPGWTWAGDVKPKAGTDSCEMPHAGVVLSGRFAVRMDNGDEKVLGPGDAHVVSAGHDAWVVGDEPCVILDVSISDGASA